jgi:tetratricopeptide (TPR) repeat protein
MTLYELSLEIKARLKEKKFASALALFKSEKVNFEAAQIGSNGYLIADLMSCLRQNKQSQYAFALLDNYDIPLTEDMHENILNAYGWVLHALLKQQHDEEDEHAMPFDDEAESDEQNEWGGVEDPDRKKLTERMEVWLSIMHSEMEGFNYTVVVNVLKTFIKTEGKRQRANWALVDRVTALFEPAAFSTVCFKTKRIVRGAEKELELASDREIWYAARTKALENLERYVDCEALCTEALGAFERFHYGNDVWFARRIALSRLNLGDSAGARKGLEGLLKKKDEWFIRKEIAELDFGEGRLEQALMHCKKALAGHGDLEYKVGLLLLTARVLKALGNKDLSERHYRLMQLVRAEQGWGISTVILQEMEDLSPSVSAMKQTSTLLRELEAFWREGMAALAVGKVQGRVEKILHDNEQGVDGFLRTDAHAHIYFRETRQSPIAADLRVGSEFEFEILSQKEGKLKAVKLRPIRRIKS